MTLTDYMYQERREEEEDLPALMHQYDGSRRNKIANVGYVVIEMKPSIT